MRRHSAPNGGGDAAAVLIELRMPFQAGSSCYVNGGSTSTHAWLQMHRSNYTDENPCIGVHRDDVLFMGWGVLNAELCSFLSFEPSPIAGMAQA